MRSARAAVALLLLLPACGKRGDPLPPLRKVPAPITGFLLAQRGDKLEIRYTTPRASVDGVRLGEMTVEAVRLDGDGDLNKAGKKTKRRTRPGEEVVVQEPLPAPGTVVHVALRAIAGGDATPRTPVAVLTVLAPFDTPNGLTATLLPDGVALAWKGALPTPAPTPSPSPSPSPLARALPGSPSPLPVAPGPPASPAPGAWPAPPSPPVSAPGTAPGAAAPPARPMPVTSPTPVPFRGGFSVYRRAENGAFAAPLTGKPIETNTLLDAGAPLGTRWCYVVRGVAGLEPLIESAPSDEACADVKDIFPPAPPGGLAALVRGPGVEIAWSPSPEADLAGYRLWRSTGTEPPERLAELPAGELQFVDKTVRTGSIYRYYLTAFDTAGNESKPSPTVEARP
jgi:hypothetical protein